MSGVASTSETRTGMGAAAVAASLDLRRTDAPAAAGVGSPTDAIAEALFATAISVAAAGPGEDSSWEVENLKKRFMDKSLEEARTAAPELREDQTALVLQSIARDGLRCGASVHRSATSLRGAGGVEERYFCYNLVNRTFPPIHCELAKGAEAVALSLKAITPLTSEELRAACDTTKSPITRKREVGELAEGICWQSEIGAFPVLAERTHTLSSKPDIVNRVFADRWMNSMLVIFDGAITTEFDPTLVKVTTCEDLDTRVQVMSEVQIDESLCVSPKAFRAIIVPILHAAAVAAAFPGVKVIAVNSVPVTKTLNTDFFYLNPAPKDGKIRVTSFVPDYQGALQMYFKEEDCPKLIGIHAVRFSASDDLKGGKMIKLSLPLSEGQKTMIREMIGDSCLIEEREDGKSTFTISPGDLVKTHGSGKGAKTLQALLNIESAPLVVAGPKDSEKLQTLQKMPELCTVVPNTAAPNTYSIYYSSDHAKVVVPILKKK